MLSLDTSIAFFAVALLLALTPGPDNLFVLMMSASQGRRAGIWVILGLCTGLIVHTAAKWRWFAALRGINDCFSVLVHLWAAYLATSRGRPIARRWGRRLMGDQLDSIQLYGRGILMNLTNPKVVLFFTGLPAPVSNT